jgi:hypothetical protein
MDMKMKLCDACEFIPVAAAGEICWRCKKDKESFEKLGLPWVAPKDRGCDLEGMPLNPFHPWNLEKR